MFRSPHDEGSQLWCDDLSRYIKDAVDLDSVEEYEENRPGRWHLGASEIGHVCSRKIWYSFRWAVWRRHTGKLHRLFKRGHWEEPKFIHRLQRIGITVWDHDPNSSKKHGHNGGPPLDDEDKVQWRIEHPQSKHFGGSLDGIVFIPWLPIAIAYMIGEFKTHNDSSFQKLIKHGVRKSKPEHYSQMCTYGKAKGYRFGLYCAVNKNDDDFWFEIVPLSENEGNITARKALEIIDSRKPPTRYSENSATRECKFCDYRGVCHLGQAMHVSCRSCIQSIATPNGEWYCSRFAIELDRDTVHRACGYWQPNNV